MAKRKLPEDHQMQMSRALRSLGVIERDNGGDQKLEAFMRVFHPEVADDFTAHKNRMERARDGHTTI